MVPVTNIKYARVISLNLLQLLSCWGAIYSWEIIREGAGGAKSLINAVEILCGAVFRPDQLSADWLRIRDGSWMGLAPEQGPRCRQNIFCARKYLCLCDEKSSANVFKSGKGHSRDHFRTALKIATLSALCRCCLHSKCRIGYERVRMMVIFARILFQYHFVGFCLLWLRGVEDDDHICSYWAVDDLTTSSYPEENKTEEK